MVWINGLFHLLRNMVHWGYNPLILTFDPNFLGNKSMIMLKGRFKDVPLGPSTPHRDDHPRPIGLMTVPCHAEPMGV